VNASSVGRPNGSWLSRQAARVEVPGAVCAAKEVSDAVSGGFVLVQALDPFGNVDPNYTGTVHLTSTDPQAYLDPDYLFGAQDAGQHAFYVVLYTAGTNRSITATDTVTATITGTQSGIVVTGADAVYFIVSNFTPNPVAAGAPGSFTVTGIDAYNNVASAYAGTVHFTSSDPQASLPGDYTFTAQDAGRHTGFSATLRTFGVQSITATDTMSGATGTEDDIAVIPPPGGAPDPGAGSGDSQGGVVVGAAGSSALVGGGSSSAAGGTACAADGRPGYESAATGYTGQPMVPADRVFAGARRGPDSFSAVLNTPADQWVGAIDALMAGFRGKGGDGN
jgi:hypothetical protein